MANTKITTNVIADDAVTNAKVADNAIDSDQYVDGSIDTAHFAAGAIDAAAMGGNSVATAAIQNNAVRTEHISDGHITTAKIADDAITSAKLDTNITIAGTLGVSGAFTSLGIDDNANALAITIDSSENVMIGKTSSSGANKGVELRQTGLGLFTGDGTYALQVRRLTDDGNLAEFYTASVGVGVLGTLSGDLYIGNADVTLQFNDSADAITPRGTAGAQRDGAVSLGTGGNRFKDLHMGGNALIGGTLGVTGLITGTTATASGSTSTTALASTAFVQQELTTLIGGAPSTLNDLNELAAAINDDANYNSTLTTALATKVPLAGGTMTGNLSVGGVPASSSLKEINVNKDGSGSQIGIDIHNTGTNAADDAVISFETNGQVDYTIGIDRSTNVFAIARAGNLDSNQRLGIDINGNVKIGNLVTSATAAPLFVAKSSTDVQAIFGDNNNTIDDPSIRIIGRDTANSAIRYAFFGLDADANHGFIGYNAGAGGFVNALNFDTSGFVGIGETDPKKALHITRGDSDLVLILDQNNVVNDQQICFAHDYGAGSTTGGNYWALGVDGSENELVIAYDANSQASVSGDRLVTFTSGGYVGINETSPDTRLHVSGNVKVGSAASSTWSASSHGAGGLDVFVGSGSDGLTVWDDNSQSAPRFTVQRAGNVGIGTTGAGTNAKLNVAGGINFVHSPASAAGLNVVSQFSFNNSDTANACGTVYYKCFYINFYHNNGHSQCLFLANGGGGVGYNFTGIVPGNTSLVTGTGINTSFTTIGSSPNTFQVQISSGGGALTVSRTSGTGSFQINVQVMTGG